MTFTTSARPPTKRHLVLLLQVQLSGVLVVEPRPSRVQRFTTLARRGLVAEQEKLGELRRFALAPLGEETLRKTPEAVLMDAHTELLAGELRSILQDFQRRCRSRLIRPLATTAYRAILDATGDAQKLVSQRAALLALCAQRRREHSERLQAEHDARQLAPQALQPTPAQQGEEA